MSKITDNFKYLAQDRKIEFKTKEIETPIRRKDGEDITQKQIVFQTALRINDDKAVACGVIVHDSDQPRVNYQVTYNKIGQVTDRNKMPQITSDLNDINAMRSGYYRFVVSGDGEIIMRHLGITGEDASPMMDVFVYGGRILRAVLPELEKIEGVDLSQAKS
ncbi:MAG: hypothetical protein ACTHVM_06885 [Alkalibacterium gilvum]|uniref:Uncharacterized protein n=1 Tax=Alkalibacterium gilvum TaxID=1130080 RepID=A0A1H6V5U0_9LACT|nr:hypothetical protein [Alkalibacterium gilvum]MDN6204723.1 hypothetical protein [Tetragenococcus halophilus]MDN6294714.1 hypothetical protein [Alkalibacterium sp.]MDN6398345.1 hypothetical protein [Alkalibacterium sp.]MDN6409536.1 hypothetical protein [Tetragenococcus halophilus]MDN6730122.1 hypothetical protein [Alkalibacterium sp.]